MRYLKLFESFTEPTYQRITYDIYSQSRNKSKSIPFSKLDLEIIKENVNGKVESFTHQGGHKKRYTVRIEGNVPFLGHGLKSVPLFITISKFEDDWFFVHVTINERLNPEGIGSLDQSFWKCDQIEGVIDLIKNEIKVDI